MFTYFTLFITLKDSQTVIEVSKGRFVLPRHYIPIVLYIMSFYSFAHVEMIGSIKAIL